MHRQLFGLIIGMVIILVGCGNDDKPINGGTAVRTWEKTFGGTGFERAQSIITTGDGNYLITGYSTSFGAGSDDVYLIKIDGSGRSLWTRTYGGNDYDRAYDAVLTNDGGYAVLGGTASFGAGGWDVYLIKLVGSGDTIFTKTFGDTGMDIGESLVLTGDGGYLVAASTQPSRPSAQDIYLIRTNESGDTIWTRTYNITFRDYARSIIANNDGSFIIVGQTGPSGPAGWDIFMMKVDASGDTLWTKTHGGADGDYGYSVIPTGDGGYMVAAQTKSFGAGGYDVYLLKTDASGDTVWTRTYGGTGNDYCISVAQTSDGGYVLVGTTDSYGAGGLDVYLIKTDAAGDTVWTRTYGRTGDEYGNSVALTGDGGYIVAGYTYSFGAGGTDMYVIKVDADGNL